MAPKKAAKCSDAAGIAPAAKKHKQDPNVVAVVEAVELAVDLPEVSRKMLAACVPHCFATPPHERRRFHAEVTRLIGEAIRGVEMALQKAADGTSGVFLKVEASKRGLQTALEEADAAVVVVSASVQAKTARLEEAMEEVQSGETALRAAEEAKRKGETRLLEAQQKKALLEKAMEPSFRAILEGSGESEEHCRVLLPLLSGLGLDESLLSALPSICMKMVADRNASDLSELEQLGARLREQLASSSKAVEEATAASHELASAAEGTQARLDSAMAARTCAAEELKLATVGERAAAEAARAARERLIAIEPEYAEAAREKEGKIAALEKFKIYNVACFEQLREGASCAELAGAGA